MLPKSYPTQICSAARALEIVGERWTLLLIREAFFGRTRFDEFRTALGIAPNVLSARLQRLTDEGVFDRVRYQDRPERYTYSLTAKGRELGPLLIHLMNWGDRHYPAPGGPPTIIRHRGCGGELDDYFSCMRCGERVAPEAFEAVAGPGRPGGTPAPV